MRYQIQNVGEDHWIVQDLKTGKVSYSGDWKGAVEATERLNFADIDKNEKPQVEESVAQHPRHR